MSLRATTAVTAVVLAALALLALLLRPAPAEAVQPAQPSAPAAAPLTPEPAADLTDGFLPALLGDGTDVDPATAAELTYAADRVCEGITAGVPEGFMIRTVSEEQGVTLEDAHTFVETAARVHCAA